MYIQSHTYIYPYINTYRLTDRQTDRQTCIHVHMHIRTYAYPYMYKHAHKTFRGWVSTGGWMHDRQMGKEIIRSVGGLADRSDDR